MSKLFLDYQKQWINDKSRFKIIEKSRRTGMTFAQSWEDVEDCLKKRVPSVWFSSSDESAAKEYIEYCQGWANSLNKAAIASTKDEIIDKESVTTIRFNNGTKIVALSSNPKAFRSKGGKVVLDEFAFHDNAEALYRAAKPSITSMKGLFPLRIISTHNGKNCKYYQFLKDSKDGKMPWSVHYVDIFKAVEQGYLDRIMGRETTSEERQEWLEQERRATGDESLWLQEYCCIPVDEATAFFTFDLIKTCEFDNILYEDVFPPSNYYIGIDFGRQKDLTVAWVIEKEGSLKTTRYILEMQNTPYSEQVERLSDLIIRTNARKVCADATGIGDMPVEKLQELHGEYTVEKVKFTNTVKEELVINTKMHFEDRLILIPEKDVIRRDLHSIRKIVTVAGNTRYDAKRTKDGHADRFWALALSLHATDNERSDIIHVVTSRNRYSSSKILRGY